jgi:DNA-binding MarR family transcriptional regulator
MLNTVYRVTDTRVIAKTLLDLFSALQLRGGGEHLKRLETEGLSLTQYKTLSILDRSPGTPSVKELAIQLNLSAPAASRAVDGLVHRGWVERAEDGRDRRQRSLRLAEPGRQIVRELDELRLDGWEEFVQELDPAVRDALHSAVAPIVTDRARPGSAPGHEVAK